MQTGDVIADRFHIGQLVGTGAMGAVFRARDRQSGEDVAVKVMLDVADQSEARFEREAHVLAGITHEHVVRYVAHGLTSREEAYLVMEWIEGEDLSRLLARGRLRVEASVALGARVASALAEAHARGVIHRDLKPSNLILEGGEVDRVKVLDFGIARLSGASRATQTGAVLGTPGYLPPEQARGDDDIDPRADLFSLGCVLFECLTGAPAFAGQHLPAILAKILFEPAPSVRVLCPEAPEPLERLIARMLHKDPSQRPTSAEAASTLASLDLVTKDTGSGGKSKQTEVLAPVLTGDEQRVLSVVMIGPPGPRSRNSAREVELLRQGALARGARLERMADGSLAAILLDALSPLDEASQAARVALGLHAIVPGRAIVMATGRSGGLFKPTVGDAINRAVALLDACLRSGDPPGAPLVDKATARLLGARFEVRPHGVAFELVAERDPLATARTLLGRFSPYVGRKTELAALTGLFTECVEESVARAAVVTAPAGVGKSRLAYELLRAARQLAPTVTIWTAQGDALRAGAAFGLLGRAIRAAADLRDGEPLQVRRDKLRARVAERVAAPDRARVTEFLGELVGVPFSDDGSPALFAARMDARLLRDQMLRAWADFLRAECAAHPVLLMLDDLHWGDTSTIRCVGMALESLKGLPFFVLGLARPEVSQLFPKLWEEQGALTVRLRELTRKASEQLVRQALGAEVNADVVERLVSQANGHAFYLEELIRTVAEGREDVTRETLLAIIEARLQQLAPEARRVLRAASVFGEVFWSSGVSALLGGAPVAEIERQLDALAAQEVLVARPGGRFSGEAEYAFLHGLLRESAYAMLTDDDRSLGHRLAGEWLERHGEGDPLVLAEHFDRGRLGERAGAFYVQATNQAYRAGDSDATIARANRGLATELPGELRGALLGVLCETHMARFEWTAADGLIEEAMRLVRPGSTPWIHVATAKFGLLVLHGAHDALAAHVELFQVTPIDPAALGFAAQSLGLAIALLHQLGQLDIAQIALGRLEELLDPLADRDGIARGWLDVARCAEAVWADGDPFRGLLHARAADESFQSAGYPAGLRVAQLCLGMCLWWLGALDEAERTLRAVTMDWSLGEFALVQEDYLARVLIDRGHLDQAKVVACSLIKKAREVRVARYEGRGRWLLSRIHVKLGDLDAAAREAVAALDLMPRTLVHRLPAQMTLASVRLAQGRPVEALALVEDSARTSGVRRASGMHAAHARLIHAEALAANGDEAGALAVIDEALARILADAEKIGDPALRAAFLDAVPENVIVAQLAAARRAPRSTPPARRG